HVNCTNQWDNGYPLGGNYWSDYTGVDIFSGPNQDQPGGDGIGDTPYSIQGGNDRDRYPLTGPFETIHPLPPTILQATLTGTALEDVTLKWALSLDDGAGFQTVVGYRIFRNTTFNPDGLGYSLIASLPSGNSEFVDSMAGEGDPNNYFYTVCAVDSRNKSRCSENQAGKYIRPLAKGMNLASVPLVQSDENISTVLQVLSFDKAWSYDSFFQEWKWFMKSKPYVGDSPKINHFIGFWLDVIADSNLTVAGLVPSTRAIFLKAGWNLVGFPSFRGNFTVGDLKATIPLVGIEGYNATASPYFLKPLQDSNMLQAGHGYWIQVATDSVWSLSNN
ncbi:MAG: hypothetical protein KAW09_06550, partial [Thermoplasmata archaeon]|nr:hypothetical protein [Thermoplasmata archaeon]